MIVVVVSGEMGMVLIVVLVMAWLDFSVMVTMVVMSVMLAITVMMAVDMLAVMVVCMRVVRIQAWMYWFCLQIMCAVVLEMLLMVVTSRFVLKSTRVFKETLLLVVDCHARTIRGQAEDIMLLPDSLCPMASVVVRNSCHVRPKYRTPKQKLCSG